MDEGRALEPALLAGRYELGPLLGHGGMAAVREATDRRLGRRVAVKILRSDLAEQPGARRRFESEAHAAARLAHPNVVTVFDSGESDGVPFIVMERLPGRTLEDEIAAGPLAVDRMRSVGREILSALDAAHRAGIVHRDIKPGNVLLTDDGHVKVSDFGIAKTVDDVDQTQTTELVATPEYLAPERVAGEAASRQSDLYSVGVLLYVALSGRRPFEGETPLAIMRAIEHGHPAPLSVLRPDVAADIIVVVERAMLRDPGSRFASAGEMSVALEPSRELDETAPVGAGVDGAAETVSVDLGAVAAATEALRPLGPADGAPRDSAAGRRRPLVALGIGAATAAIVVVGLVFGGGGGTPAAPLVPTSSSSPATASPITSKLPAALDAAIRQVERAITK